LPIYSSIGSPLLNPGLILSYAMMQLQVAYLRDVLIILDQYQMKSLDTHSKTEAQESSPPDAVSEKLDENDTSVDDGSVFDDANSQEPSSSSSSSTTSISSGDQVSDDDEALYTATDFIDILK
jgi:hypothetical protein